MNKTTTGPVKKRARIGLLFDSLWDDFESTIWHGAVDEARKQDVSLFCFAGGALNSPMNQHRVREVIHNFIGRDNIDGLLVISGCVGAFLTVEQMRQYLARFTDIPLISVSTQFDDIPSMIVDSRSGMYELVSHLIKTHQRRRIAFITGPENSFDAEERFTAYKKALSDHDIPYDPSLIVPGNFLHGIGERAAVILVKERKTSFDAVVGANDNMALGAMRMLRRLGINVPDQVAVGGFDNSRGARSVTPTLTTVRQPTYEIGRQAVRDLLNWITTGTAPASSKLPTRLVIHGSCGCVRLGHGYDIETTPVAATSMTNVANVLPKLVTELNRHFITLTDILDSDAWAHTLVDAYVTEHSGGTGTLRRTLEVLMAQSEQKPLEPSIWAEVLRVLFSVFAPYLPCNPQVRESTLVVADQYIETRRAFLWIEYEYQTEMLQRLLQPVRATFELRDLGHIVKDAMPQIGINGFSLSLYDDRSHQMRDLSHLVIQLKTVATGEHTLQTYTTTDAPRFQTRDFAPGGFRDSDRAVHLNIFPLSFEDEHFGLAVYEIGNLSTSLYEIATSHLISLIKSVSLVEETKNYTDKLERDVAVRTTELRVANEMLQKTNSLMHNKNLEIEKLNAELLQKSKLDGLTNLYNRRAALDLLKSELNRTRRSRERDKNGTAPANPRSFAVMMLDIDHFKLINDTYGHLTGDQVLRGVGELLKEAGVLRQEDIIGRFGGEEFIVILPDTSAASAELPATRLAERLKNSRFTDQNNRTFTITFSIGISEYGDSDTNEETIIHRADQALYYAKNHGRDRIIVYEQLPAEDRLKLQVLAG